MTTQEELMALAGEGRAIVETVGQLLGQKLGPGSQIKVDLAFTSAQEAYSHIRWVLDQQRAKGEMTTS